ncbi:MAG: FAD:protein FMN transferase [Magnetococcales bacterium]|nr:FAD:protein FMN transferase [Magnetococcales bacterium]
MRRFTFPFQAMGGPGELVFYAPDQSLADKTAHLVRQEIARLEARYSRYRPESIVSRINRSAGKNDIRVDAETAALLDYAATCHTQSQGRFDITSGILRKCWDFKSQHIPSQNEIDQFRPLIGWGQVIWENPRLRLPHPGMEIDLGGVVKEYGVDRCVVILQEEGIRHGFVNLAGDLKAIGPHPDGRPWGVGVHHPRKPGSLLARIPLLKGALATSGDYERVIMQDGQRLSHLLNPLTGRPVTGGLGSVSVLAPHCLIAGSIATVAMLQERPGGIAWLQEMGLPNVQVDDQGEVTSHGIQLLPPPPPSHHLPP